jgi:hypothetical protein
MGRPERGIHAASWSNYQTAPGFDLDVEAA